MGMLWIVFFQLLSSSAFFSTAYQGAEFENWYQQPVVERPIDVVTDVVNDLGMKILRQYVTHGNVAFSPIGAAFVLAALYEGSSAKGSCQIAEALGLPRDRDVTRIGFRDIHRRLRTYLNADGFLGGLTLNRENTRLRPEYEDVLRFYGFSLTAADDEKNDMGTTESTKKETTTTEGASTQPSNDESPSTIATMTSTDSKTLSPMPETETSVDVTEIPTTMPTSVETTSSETSITVGSSQVTTTPPTKTTTSLDGPDQVTNLPEENLEITSSSESRTESSTSEVLSIPTTMPANNTSSNAEETTTIVSSTEADFSTVTSNDSNSNATATATVEGLALPSTSEETPTSMDSMPIDGTDTTNPISIDATETSMSNENAATNRVRRRSAKGPRGYFSSYPDEGIWMQDLGFWKAYPSNAGEVSVRDSTEISFLVNGCDVSSVMATRYIAVLPFAYFPSLNAIGLEFPLDNPRYNIFLLTPTDRMDIHRLARDLDGKSLRWLRKQLQSTWVRATIPSFMLRGFVTLTPLLQRLGITDVFEPRVADLSPMTPDLGVYARDVQQSIGVNIRNYMKADRTHSRNGLFERAGPVPFTALQPFLYFIVDAETSVTLIVGRVDDPLNSRIL